MRSFGGNLDGSDAFEDPELDTVAAMLADDPDQVYLRRRYGLLLFRRRRFKDAATQFSQWAREAPGDRESFLFLARALLRLQMYDFARAAAEMASENEALLPSVSRTLQQISEKEATLMPFGSDVADRNDDLQRDDSDIDSDTPDLVAFVGDDAEAGLGHARGETLADMSREVSPPSLAGEFYRKPRHTIADRIDACLRFIALIKGLILRNVSFTLENKLASLFLIGGQMLIIIDFHVMLFYVTGRNFAGQISLLSATVAPFLSYNCFKQIKSRVNQHAAGRSFNRSLNIKWGHLFLADAIWDLVRIVMASIILIVLSELFMSRVFTGPIVPPNIPRILTIVLLAATLGAALGMAVEALETRWPLFKALDHILNWIMYITSGVYSSYITDPSFLSVWFKINPLLTLTEYNRQGFDGSYPVGDLTLWYPMSCVAVMLILGLALRAKAVAEWHEPQHA